MQDDDHSHLESVKRLRRALFLFNHTRMNERAYQTLPNSYREKGILPNNRSESRPRILHPFENLWLGKSCVSNFNWHISQFHFVVKLVESLEMRFRSHVVYCCRLQQGRLSRKWHRSEHQYSDRGTSGEWP